MKKHTIIILSIMLAVVVLVSASVSIFAWWYANRDRSDSLSETTMLEYNLKLTTYARSTSSISSKEVIIVHNMSKELGKDMVVKFYVYSLEEGETDADLLRLSPEEIESDGKRNYMAHGSCTLLDDNIANIRDLTVLYVR